MKKIIFVIIITALLGGFYWYITESISINTNPTEVVSNTIVEQNPVLLERLKTIGAEYTDKINLIYLADMNDIPGTDQPIRDTIIGMYVHTINEDTIYVKIGAMPDREIITIAHEYLHYIWNRVLSQTEQDTIMSTSQSLIDQDWYLSGYMDFRKSHNTYSDREIFPVICTERPDQYISAMVDTCNKYIDRSKLTFLYR